MTNVIGSRLRYFRACRESHDVGGQMLALAVATVPFWELLGLGFDFSVAFNSHQTQIRNNFEGAAVWNSEVDQRVVLF